MNKSAELTGTRYVLAVKDLGLSSAYYRDKLGFKTVWEDGGSWHFLYRGACAVMLGECPDDRSAFETANHSYFAYVEVEDIDNLYEEFKQKGVEIPTAPEDKPWGQREFSIRTIDGHRMMFGESLSSEKLKVISL